MAQIIQTLSPVDGHVVAERPVASEEAIELALSAARAAQKDWARRSVEERARVCGAIVDAMLAMKDDIAPELAQQMGRPIRYCAGELRGFEERARHMISIAGDALSPVSVDSGEGVTRSIEREPIGVLFVIAPWNYPYLTVVNSLVPALMAGNAVILKHAPQTLLVGERFQAACDDASLPAGLFANLVLSHEQADDLLASGSVDRVHFTGSVASGSTVEKAAGGAFVGVGLELGGKDPAYVRADADLDHAVEQLVDGAFFNSGQSCCAVERIYVDEAVYSGFVDAFVASARQYVLGDPMDPETTLGPMISASAAAFVRKQVRDAVAAGARTLIEPSDFAMDDPETAFMAPQVVVDVDHSMSLMRDESFGPVVGIMSVADETEALSLMNDSVFGLTASIWTQDLEAAKRLGTEVEAGTVFVNRCDYLDPALAWSGVKNSGRGATLSVVGYEHLTRPKSYYLKQT